MNRISRLLLPLAALLFLAAAVQARKPGTFPDFALTASDGQTVRSSQLRLPSHWLLIYVHPDSGATEAVLNAFKDERPGSLNQKVIVIVGGAAGQDLPAMAARYPHLASVTWYADPDTTAFDALKLRGSPTVLGVRQDTIQWSLVGALSDPGRLKSILKSWKDKDK